VTLTEYLTAGEAQPEDLPALLAELERLRGELWGRLVAASQAPAPDDAVALLDVEQARQFLNVPRSYVYDLARQHKLPHVKVGKYLRFRLRELRMWLDGLDKSISTVYSPPSGRSDAQAATATARAHSRGTRQERRRPLEHRSAMGARRGADQTVDGAPAGDAGRAA
jgi:excisionase family DNA binding protein